MSHGSVKLGTIIPPEIRTMKYILSSLIELYGCGTQPNNSDK